MKRTVVKPFNDLPYEERNKMVFYITESNILKLKQCISLLENSIGDYQKQKIREWIKNLEKWNKDNYILESEEK